MIHSDFILFNCMFLSSALLLNSYSICLYGTELTLIGYHSSHFGEKIGLNYFRGVTNDTDEGSGPFCSNRVRVMILCVCINIDTVFVSKAYR